MVLFFFFLSQIIFGKKVHVKYEGSVEEKNEKISAHVKTEQNNTAVLILSCSFERVIGIAKCVSWNNAFM